MNIKYTRADKSACTGICGAGIDRYRAAPREGEIVGEVPPCLLYLGLLRKLEDAGAPNSGAPCVRYMPVPPAVAAANLARPVEEAIEAQRS